MKTASLGVSLTWVAGDALMATLHVVHLCNKSEDGTRVLNLWLWLLRSRLSRATAR